MTDPHPEPVTRTHQEHPHRTGFNVVFPEKLDALLIVIGLILVYLGRRAYLISVGILGFLGGLYLFTTFIGSVHDWRSMLFALLFGTVVSLLAFSLHKAAWIFGGFCGGGVLLLYLNNAMNISGGGSTVSLFVIGGIGGAILFLLLLDRALILVTSLIGAALITYQSRLGGASGLALFVVLLFTGILVQDSSLRRDRREDRVK